MHRRRTVVTRSRSLWGSILCFSLLGVFETELRFLVKKRHHCYNNIFGKVPCEKDIYIMSILYIYIHKMSETRFTALILVQSRPIYTKIVFFRKLTLQESQRIPFIHISDLVMMIKWSTNILKIIKRKMRKLKIHRPMYCVKGNGENGLNLRRTLDRIYLTSILYDKCFQIGLHNDDNECILQTTKGQSVQNVANYLHTSCAARVTLETNPQPSRDKHNHGKIWQQLERLILPIWLSK